MRLHYLGFDKNSARFLNAAAEYVSEFCLRLEYINKLFFTNMVERPDKIRLLYKLPPVLRCMPGFCFVEKDLQPCAYHRHCLHRCWILVLCNSLPFFSNTMFATCEAANLSYQSCNGTKL